jgi:hypothetical protein
MSRLIFSELGTTPSDTDSGASQIYVKDDGSLYLKRGSSAEGIIGSNWTVTGNDIYYNTGDVGIGTTAPGQKLQVKDGSSLVSITEYQNGATIWMDGANGDLSGGDYFGIHARDAGAALDFSYAGTNHLTILPGGNVGIGTTAPLGQLHIQHATNTGMASANHIFGISTGGISISAVPIAKAWVTYEGKNNSGIVGGQSYNVSSVTNPSGTLNQVNFATDMSSADYVVVATLTRGQTWNGDIGVEYLTQTASSVRFQAGNSGGAFGSTEHEISVVIYAL